MQWGNFFMNKKEVGQFVHKTRKLLKISQMIMSKKTNVSQAKISKVEAGKLELSVSEFVKVLKAFGLKIEITKE